MSGRSFRIHSDYHEESQREEELDGFNAVSSDGMLYHILDNGQKYEAKVLSSDANAKAYRVEINGTVYHISLKDEYDILVDKMGLSISTEKKSGNIIAPMPGLVLDIMINEGDEVEKGDALFILEAMKMENVIKADGKATIKKIHCTKGDSVDKSQLIIEMI